MAINFNTGPYFDDFDPANNFYKVLFKPGYAVQARELNQLQSILQHQVGSVGNHIFKKNAMVIPGGISLTVNANMVFVSATSNITDFSTLVGKTITNAASFDYTNDSTLDGYITAVVLGYRNATSTVPAALHVKYFKSNSDGRATFNTAETLKTVEGTITTLITDSTVPSGLGKVATIAKGVFYTDELFVDALSQTIIVETDSTITTNCTIGLNIVESIVTSDDNETLLDNANGAPNQYAPGADRYKVQLVLTRVDDENGLNLDKFITMMHLENNVITYVNDKTEYAELMKTLARRTYDANGNFIVEGLQTSVNESSDAQYIWTNVKPGRCYLGGYEYDQMANVPVAIQKPRDAAHTQIISNVNKFATGLTEFFVAGGAVLLEIPETNTLVQFLNAAPGTSGVSVVGYGVFKEIQYYSGTIGSNDIYKVFFDWVTLESGYSLTDLGGFKVIAAAQGAPILHEIKLKGLTGTFSATHVLKSTTISSQTGTIFAVINYTTLYVVKDSLFEVPNTETMKDNTSSAVGTLTNYFISNYSNVAIPMIKLDNDVVKTLYANGANTTSYSVVRKNIIAVTSGHRSQSWVLTTTGETYEDYSTNNYYAYIVETGIFLDLTGLYTLSSDYKTFTFNLGSTSTYDAKTIWIFSTINKVNSIQATKTKATVTVEISTPSKSFMALDHQDATRIIKVVDGGNMAVTFTDTGDLVNKTAHGLVNGNIVRFSVITSTTGISINTNYYVVNKTDNTFQVSATLSGAALPLTTNGSGTVLPPPDINNSADVTSRYVLETGNDANVSGTSLIKLRKNGVAAVGRLAVQYEYYSIGSTGDYISVDSYGDYTNADLSYIGAIKDVLDNNNTTIHTRSHIDYRMRTSSYFFKNMGTILDGTATLTLKDLNLTVANANLVGSYVVGPGKLNGVLINSVALNAAGNTVLTLASTVSGNQTGIYYIGLTGAALSLVDSSAGGKAFTFPKDSSRLMYNYVKFTVKKVLVYIDRVSDVLSVKFMEVNSINEANALRKNEFKLPLVYMEMAPYTVNINDVTIYNFDNPVYKMLDIHDIKLRLDRAEYYSSLAMNQDLGKAILDANNENLTQSKYGFWNEHFMDLTNQDYASDDFKCTIYDRSYVSPGVVTRTVNVQLDNTQNTSTWKQTGTALTLPYTEQRVFGNTKASKYNNLNPFNIITWIGKLSISPTVDNWVDTTTSPTVVTINNTAIVNVIPNPIIIIDPPTIVVQPPPALPPQVDEVITNIDNLKVSWGPDSQGGKHAITFDWKTNYGRIGRVNTDMHLSPVIKTNGYDGVYAKSLINKRYNDNGVKEYLSAGTHFDIKPPAQW